MGSNAELLQHELIDYVDTSRSNEETFHYLGFEFLHRLNIVSIQNKLIELRERIASSRGRELDDDQLAKLLSDYSQKKAPHLHTPMILTLVSSHCYSQLQLCP